MATFPNPEDVRAGVIYGENDELVGTLQVHETLLLADFLWYTDNAYDTFVCGINETYKTAFAIAERYILERTIKNFNPLAIAEMYQDFYFLEFLRYAVLVQYYSSACLNGTQTTGEPTTEVVNFNYNQISFYRNQSLFWLNKFNAKFNVCTPKIAPIF